MSRYQNALALRDDVRKHEDAFKELMPKGYRLDRFMSTLDIWVQQNPELLRCDPLSIVAECQKAVHDGMVFDRRIAILVPFYDRKNKRFLAQYMPMYQGILQRLHELGDVKGLTCHAVYQADQLEVYTRDNKTIIDWAPATDGADRGFVRAAFVHFEAFNGQIIHTEIMMRDEIEKARLKSQNPNGEAWREWYGEMAKKTVIHRGAKFVPLSDEGRRIVTREEAFTLLEGQALPAPRAAGDNPLADHSLDDFDDDGNFLRQSAPEPEPDPVPPRDRIDDAEVIVVPPRDAQENDVELCFDVPSDQPPERPLIELFEIELGQATSIADAQRLSLGYRPHLAHLSRDEKLRANAAWTATVARLTPAPAAAATAPRAKKPAQGQRRRA